MVYVDASGTLLLLRGVNDAGGTSTGNCGFTTSRTSRGSYLINFGFQISDRFVSVTPRTSGGNVNIGATFNIGTNSIEIITFIPDVDWAQSFADNAFMVIVY